MSVDPQRIFSLSLGDPEGWRAADKDAGLIAASDFKKGDLSLARSRGREKDAGDYRCRVEFNNSRSLERRVHVHVLQSEWKPALTSADLASLLCCVALFSSSSCPATSQPDPLIVSHKKMSSLVFSLSVSPFLLRCTSLFFSSLGSRVYLGRLGPQF